MKVVRVSRDDFEMEDGSVYPITPPLEEDLTPDEFQEHYNIAAQVIQSIKTAGSDHTDD